MKKIKLLLFAFLLFNLCYVKVSAEYFSASASSTQVKVGDTVKITAYLNSYESGLKIYSSDSSVLSGDKTVDWVDSGSYSTYFTAKKTGTATIYIATTNGTTMDPGNEKDANFTRSIAINVVSSSSGQSNVNDKPNKTIDVNKKYSKNNDLKSLSVKDNTLTPNFDKNTLEYKVTLTPGTEKINIEAVADDKTAKIKGIGEVSVSEGVNTFSITVTAENGNEKVYKIIATMEEKDPINVKIGKSNYTVVKKKELLGEKQGFKESTVKINDFDIPSLYNEITKINLVGLKDENGNILLYSYDTKTGKYNKFIECTFDQVGLTILENKKSKYESVNIKINDKDVMAYKVKGMKEYYLLYATNNLTGYTGYYLYDVKENTVQRYNTELLDKITKEKDKYLAIVLVLSSVCFLTMLFLLIMINKKKNEN